VKFSLDAPFFMTVVEITRGLFFEDPSSGATLTVSARRPEQAVWNEDAMDAAIRDVAAGQQATLEAPEYSGFRLSGSTVDGSSATGVGTGPGKPLAT
jgi:hypothetical protein